MRYIVLFALIFILDVCYCDEDSANVKLPMRSIHITRVDGLEVIEGFVELNVYVGGEELLVIRKDKTLGKIRIRRIDQAKQLYEICDHISRTKYDGREKFGATVDSATAQIAIAWSNSISLEELTLNGLYRKDSSEDNILLLIKLITEICKSNP